MCTSSVVILAYSLLFASSSFVNSEKHKISDYNLSKRNVHNRTNHTSVLSHGSFYRLSVSYGVWEEKSTEAKSNQNGSQYKFYGTSDTEASVLDMNPTEDEVKDRSDYTVVAKTEFETPPPLNISRDKIIDVPKRKCPAGTKMDPNGQCKTVWKTLIMYVGKL